MNATQSITEQEVAFLAGGLAVATHVVRRWSETGTLGKDERNPHVNFPKVIKSVLKKGSGLTPRMMLRLVNEVAKDLGEEHALSVFRDAFIRHHPNPVRRNAYELAVGKKSKSDLVDVMVELVELADREHAHAMPNHDLFAPCKGFWLEIVDDGTGRLTYSVGAFYSGSGRFAYTGTAYAATGVPDYYWGSKRILLSDDPRRLEYLYWHERGGTQCGDGKGVIYLMPKGDEQGQLTLVFHHGYFVDLHNNDAQGRPVPVVKLVRMEPLREGLAARGVTLKSCSWTDINAAMLELCSKRLP